MVASNPSPVALTRKMSSGVIPWVKPFSFFPTFHPPRPKSRLIDWSAAHHYTRRQTVNGLRKRGIHTRGDVEIRGNRAHGECSCYYRHIQLVPSCCTSPYFKKTPIYFVSDMARGDCLMKDRYIDFLFGGYLPQL